MQAVVSDLWQIARSLGFVGNNSSDSPEAFGFAPQSVSIFSKLKQRIKRPGAIAISAMALILIAAMLYMLLKREVQQPATASQISSIAVLPFKPLAEGSINESLELGMTETLITRLSGLNQIKVLPIGLVRQYRLSDQDAAQAGRQLNVEAVLDGSIQRSNEMVRVKARFVRVSDGTILWSDTFDERWTNLFVLQDSIAERIAKSLEINIGAEEEKALMKRYTDNVEVYDLYMQGLLHWNKYTEEGFRKSIVYFEQAIAKDAHCAPAYSGLADAYTMLNVEQCLPPKEVMHKAKMYARKAVELDEKLAEAHTSLAMVKIFYDWDWDGAGREFKRALELNPNSSSSRHYYGHYLQAMGRSDEALREIKIGHEIDPQSIIIDSEIGWAYYYARNYEQAVAEYQRTLKMDISFYLVRVCLAQAYLRMGLYNEAFQELNIAKGLSNAPYVIAELGCAYAASGNRAEAQRIIRELNERARREWVDPYLIAIIYTELGDKDQAFKWLEKSYKERSPWIAWLPVEPKFDSLRTDSRFNNVLKRVGLTQ
jgi:TolB-like protein/Tfp pilus assembly protein PilF